MNLPKGSGLEQISKALSPGIKRIATAAREKGLFNIKLPNLKYTVNRDSSGKTCKRFTLGGGQPLFRGNPLQSLMKNNPFQSLAKNNPLQSLMKNNPLQSLMKNVTGMLSQFTGRQETEDYDTIVKRLLPDGAKILNPQYPRGADRYYFADLDGDSGNELVVSYKQGEGLKTAILKKQGDNWAKAAELNHLGHDGVNYRYAADIAGEGKPQLLLGMSSKGKANKIYGYSLADNAAKKLFDRDYDWVELTSLPKSRNTKQNMHLAVWNRDENGMYNIEAYGWNGLQLEPAVNAKPYYSRRVVPYYMRKAKQNTNSPHIWYSLADSFKKAESYGYAYRIANAGSKLETDAILKSKFTALRDEISELL